MTGVVFFISIGTVILMISLYFETKKQLVLRHKQKCNSLEIEINRTKFQLEFRDKGLNKYNFQIYNLSDSLLVQSEIKLN